MVRCLLCHMSLASQLRKPNVRHGDDVAPVRERRGTTPLAHSRVRRSNAGDDGPTRSGLLGWISCSSEGSPVMAGSVPLRPILVTGANQNGGGSSSSPLGGAGPKYADTH